MQTLVCLCRPDGHGGTAWAANCPMIGHQQMYHRAHPPAPKPTQGYDNMIGDVALEIAEHLEDSAVRFAFCATPINVEDWTNDIQKRITSLVEDILIQEKASLTPDPSPAPIDELLRSLEKRLSTAKQFALNHVVYNDAPAGITVQYANYILDTMVAVLLNKTRPSAADYITRRPQ